MREIKFRARAVASRKMFFPNSDDGWDLDNGSLRPLPNTILMQYIGLKDKNGKEIYEGDIAKDKKGKIGAIRFDVKNGRWSWDMKCDGRPLKSIGHRLYERFCQELKVIGNIHENPELMEKNNG